MQFSKKTFGDSDKKRIFAATNPTTPLNDAYHGGTSLFIKVYGLRQTTDKRRWTGCFAPEQRVGNRRYCNCQIAASQYQLLEFLI